MPHGCFPSTIFVDICYSKPLSAPASVGFFHATSDILDRNRFFEAGSPNVGYVGFSEAGITIFEGTLSRDRFSFFLRRSPGRAPGHPHGTARRGREEPGRKNDQYRGRRYTISDAENR